jgi:hypothetical protein
VREFLTVDEALSVLDYSSDDVHCFISNGMALIGGDWSTKEVKDYMENAIAIEIAKPDGMARNMKHGLCVWGNENMQDCRFFQTDEDKLRAWEALHGKEKDRKYG